MINEHMWKSSLNTIKFKILIEEIKQRKNMNSIYNVLFMLSTMYFIYGKYLLEPIIERLWAFPGGWEC